MKPHNWTLRTRLIALMVLIVGCTSIVIGGVAFLVLRSAVAQQFDTRLMSDAQSLVPRLTGNNGPTGEENLFAIGQVIGATNVDGDFVAYQVSSITTTGAKLTELSAAQSKVVERASAHAGLTTINLGSSGEYRAVTVQPRFTTGAVVVGEPLANLEKQLASDLLLIAVVVVLAILLAVLLGIFVFGRALRPLRRVATVASNVASLPLERGDVELPERVPEEDTNPHTEVGQVGSALNNLLDSVETALAVRQASEEKVRTFVADASHELRTPLASIRGYAELTRRFGGPLTEDVQHNIGRIESEAMRMTSLVEDLLLLARLDAERELETRDVDLSRMLVDVLSDANAAGPDHEWELDLPEEPVIVRGDEARLQQVFTNLLANARVHTPEGTLVSVALRVTDRDTAIVTITDNGPGIPQELQADLFERFVRGDSSRARATGSTGLGLSIVRAVVDAHGGTVSVTSAPGRTEFQVELPGVLHTAIAL
jgi:two-component system, OmpR family, sensor kinase